MTETSHVNVRLKPLRIAYVFPPNDRQSFLDAAEISTCLWGGITNPMIPQYSRVPQHMRPPFGDAPSAEEVVANFVTTFEPDIIVAKDPSKLPALEGFTSDRLDRRVRRIRELSEFLQQVRSGDPDQGVSMLHIYSHLYEKQFQFEQREKGFVLKPKRSGRGSGLYSVARWGRLPLAKDALHFEDDFDFVFQPVEYGLTVSGFEGVKNRPSQSPLSLTVSELEGWMAGEGPAILLLKHTSLNDLIAFWNLRALGRLVYAIPVDWSDVMRKYCERLVGHYYRAPDEQGVGGRWIDVLRAPSVSDSVFAKFCQSLDPKGGAEFMTGSYPELWTNDELRRRWIRPGVAYASEASQDLRVEDDRIRIPTLIPKYLDRPNVYISGSWVNHVQIGDAYGQERGSVILPMGTWNIEELLTDIPRAGKVRQVRNGFASICRRFDRHLSWKIPSGSELIPWWLRQQGWDSSPSGPGRIATQMLRALGGPSGARVICHKPVVEMLNKLVGGGARRWKSRDEILTDLKQLSGERVVAFPPDWDRLFDELVQKRLLRVGMKLTCNVCH